MIRLSHTLAHAPLPLSRVERNKAWIAQYRAGLSTTEIAARWSQAHGEYCYPELVRRTLNVLGIPRRPRGTRSKENRGMVARIAELERQVAMLLQAREVA